MSILRWVLTSALAYALGLLFIQFLTVHPLRIGLLTFGVTAVLGGLIASIVTLFDGSALLVAIALSLAAALGGYATMAHVVLSREDQRAVPPLLRRPGDPGQGHTAVVYFTHGEPQTYDPIGWLNQFREFDEQKIPFVPKLARPFFLYQLRKHYLIVGKSDHRRIHAQMMRAVERSFRARGDNTTRFYLSFLDDEPRPDAAVIQALNEGASRIVVAEVFMTISNHTAEGKELIEALHVEEEYGVPVSYTGPLYDSEPLKRMFVERANERRGEMDKGRVGVLLVGHGQPDEWDAEWPTETAQEIGFREEVLALLAADGYRRENLDLAWMEFKQPKPAQAVERFLANGVQVVLYFAAAISADAIHSQYDIPALVNQARVPEGASLINMGAWNDHPLAIEAIRSKIDAQLDGGAARFPEAGPLPAPGLPS